MATINDSNASNPNIQGTTAADTINGNGGDDVIHGNGAFSGTDTLNGGDGNDTIYTGSGANLVHGGNGIDTLNGTAQTTFQDILHGDAGVDTVNGNGGRDFLYGEAGNDIIDTGIDIAGTNGVGSSVSGGDDNDNIFSGGAISNLNGDGGNDTFHANQGLWSGSENYDGGTGSDQIVADTSNTNIGINQISNIELIDGRGFSNVNIQTSSSGNPFLDLRGVQLIGINEIHGQTGNDFIVLEGGTGGGNLALSRNDFVTGGDGNDTIYSGLGADNLNGQNGNDTLSGGEGRDILTGGAGSDTFYFTALIDSGVGSANADQILDFSSAQGDKISVTDIDANTSTGTNEAFSFVGAAAFSGVAGELRAEVGLDGLTHVYGDVNGDSTADFEIVINNAVTLSATDFVL